jgi:hypothetical protein
VSGKALSAVALLRLADFYHQHKGQNGNSQHYAGNSHQPTESTTVVSAQLLDESAASAQLPVRQRKTSGRSATTPDPDITQAPRKKTVKKVKQASPDQSDLDEEDIQEFTPSSNQARANAAMALNALDAW